MSTGPKCARRPHYTLLSTSQMLGGVKDVFRFLQTQTRRVKKNLALDLRRLWVLGFSS